MSDILDHSRRFPVGNCLACNKSMDSISGQKEDPQPGAVMVCADCSYIMEWDGSKLIELTDAAMKELEADSEDDVGLKRAITATKLYQAMRDKKPIKLIILENLQPEKCEECGKLEELRPYGVRKPNGVRKWVCMDCAKKNPREMNKAFDERMEGKNPV